MDRRDFLVGSTAALFSALLGRPDQVLATPGREIVPHFQVNGTDPQPEVEPEPEITAAVDVLVPADPEIPGDFKGSDYGADRVVASTLGDLGQVAAVVLLDRYARQVSGTNFIDCNDEQRLEAIKQWFRERESLDPLFVQTLTGLITLSIAGTYEGNTQEEQHVLYESMGWFDPADPAGTFRVPNSGYPDAHLFPIALRRGIREEGSDE